MPVGNYWKSIPHATDNLLRPYISKRLQLSLPIMESANFARTHEVIERPGQTKNTCLKALNTQGILADQRQRPFPETACCWNICRPALEQGQKNLSYA